MHCFATCYGPSVPPSTGAVFVRDTGRVKSYRVSMTGHVLESSTAFAVTLKHHLHVVIGQKPRPGVRVFFLVKKKLKLVGEPYKIFKNTAFIRNMFKSDLEVNKMLGAKIQTVSGIRGELKKAEGSEGHFRATFEDKLLMSDMVTLKTWVQVNANEYYNPMLDLETWRRLKSIGQLKYEAGVALEQKKDSSYGKQAVRTRRKFGKLHMPKKLESNLPFKSMPKEDVVTRKKSKNLETRGIKKETTAVMRTDAEHQQNSLLARMHAVKNESHRKTAMTKEKKQTARRKHEERVQALRDVHTKETKKRKYVKDGKAEERKKKKLRLAD